MKRYGETADLVSAVVKRGSGDELVMRVVVNGNWPADVERPSVFRGMRVEVVPGVSAITAIGHSLA